MDPISNMLTSIRNAQAAGKESVSAPYSKIKMEIAKVLAKEKFVRSADHQGKKIKKTIDITLNYDTAGRPAIGKIRRISKPSQRIYAGAAKMKPIRSGTGIRIISTPKGLLTDKEARKEKVGGEIICEVW